MFKMYIKINTSQMNKDGIGASVSELDNLITTFRSYRVIQDSVDSRGNVEKILETSKFGDESYLITKLENMPWFMKYVLSWNTDDNGMVSDMIDVEREMGQMCSYAC